MEIKKNNSLVVRVGTYFHLLWFTIHVDFFLFKKKTTKQEDVNSSLKDVWFARKKQKTVLNVAAHAKT
jgi:hypothetical protein